MGLSVADDDDDSPIPSPSTPAVWTQFRRPEEDPGVPAEPLELRVSTDQTANLPLRVPTSLRRPAAVSRKRLFDVESLLAPDADKMADEELPPEVVAGQGPEIDSTTQQRRDVDFHGGVFPFPPPDRKRLAISAEVDDVNINVDRRQPIRAVVCEDDVTTTSGAPGKQMTEDKRDAVISLNSLPGHRSADRDETGSRFSSTRQCVDLETTSGETTSGMYAADPEVARFWLRHANMASSRFARAFFPLPLSAYHVTCVSADLGRARDISQGHGHSQGQTQGQGRGEDQCNCESHQCRNCDEVHQGRSQGHDCIKAEGQAGSQYRGYGQGQGRDEGQGAEEFRKLPESATPTADEQNRISPVDVIATNHSLA